jgi:predicted unusual protein kinase regulating ubiquinone biosynthesis (AarF/ABC1/UbiB family)
MFSFISSVYKLYNLYKFYNKFTSLFNITNIYEIDEENYETKLIDYKKNIYNGGFIYIKLAQWIVSKYRSYDEKHIILICKYLEEIFENCPEHEIKFSEKIINELLEELNETYSMSLSKYRYHNLNSLDSLINIDSMKFIASGSIGQIYYAELKTPYYILDTSNKIFQNIEKDILANYDHIYTTKEELMKKIIFMITNFIINEDDIRYEPDSNTMTENELNKVYVYKLIKEVKDVAIKVKHPDVYYNLENELDMFNVINKLKTIPILKNYVDYQIDFNDLINNIMEQCDLNIEYENGEKLRINMAGNNLVYVPKIILHTKHCLITEFVTGKYLEEIDHYNKYKICLNFISIINKMCLVDNFVHGDLHCKNWKVVPVNDVDYQIILYDYGICFKSDDITLIQDIWKIFEDCSVKGLQNILDKLIDGDITDEIRNYIKEYLDNYKYSNLNFSKLFNEMNILLKRFNCNITSFALKISIVTSIIESTLKSQNILESEDVVYEEDKHDIKVREKKLDIISFCKSKKQFPELQKYLDSTLKKIKKKSMFSSLNLNGLDLDIPFE